MNDVIIRNVEEKDIPIIVDIQVEGWKTAYKGIIDEKTLINLNKKEKLEKRKKDYKSSGFVVAELNNEVVGYCRYIDNISYSPNVTDADCEIMALYVKPSLKNHGIGTQLFQHVAKEFRAKSKKKMILWCLKDNEPSKKFYSKMGGKIINEKTIEIDNKSYLEVCFCYEI